MQHTDMSIIEARAILALVIIQNLLVLERPNQVEAAHRTLISTLLQEHLRVARLLPIVWVIRSVLFLHAKSFDDISELAVLPADQDTLRALLGECSDCICYAVRIVTVAADTAYEKVFDLLYDEDVV